MSREDAFNQAKKEAANIIKAYCKKHPDKKIGDDFSSIDEVMNQIQDAYKKASREQGIDISDYGAGYFYDVMELAGHKTR